MLNPNSRRAINVDIEALRAYAILITLAAHLPELDASWAPIAQFFWLGGGVDLFFCVSGFVISRSLYEQVAARDTATGFGAFVGSFWLRRIFRLWPAAFLWGFVTVMLASIFNRSGAFGQPGETAITMLAGLVNVVNLHLVACNWLRAYSCSPNSLWHYWSLSLEEQFYIVFPFVVWFLPRRIILGAALCLGAYQALQVRPWGMWGWFFRTDAMLFGVAIGTACELYGVNRLKMAILENRTSRCIVIALTMMLLVVLAREAISPYFMGIVSIVSAALVFIAAQDRNYFTGNRAIRAIARYVGSRSYSIYLVHLPMYALATEVLIRTIGHRPASPIEHIALVGFALAASFLAAEASFRFVERPLRSFGRDYADRRFRLERRLAAA